MKRTILIIAIIICGKLFSYPINPASLKNLIETSDFIVFGAVSDPKEWNKVVDKYYSEKHGDTLEKVIPGWSSDGIVEITPLKIYKGGDGYSLISVKNLLGLSCPTPAFYKDKGYAIAFLRRTDDSLWITNRLSYGSKNMETTEEFFFYDSLIVSYLEILRISAGKERKKAIQEWLVKCCESEYTIWDGAIEFNTKGPYTAYYREYQKTKFDRRLSKQQIQRLEQSFFESDSISRGIMLLANTLLKYSNKDRIRQKLIQGFDYTDSYDLKDLALFINEISKSSELNAIAEKIEKSYYGMNGSRLEDYLDEFIKVARKTYPNKT